MRKVNGATTFELVTLLTVDFSILILIAFCISVPVAYYFGNLWLSNFAYKTDIGIWPIISSAAICIVIALGTAGYQAIKAALIDPAKTLRNE